MSAARCDGSGKAVVYDDHGRWVCTRCGGSWPGHPHAEGEVIAVWEDLAPEHPVMTREGKLQEAIEAVHVAIGLTDYGEDGELQAALTCLLNAKRGDAA